MKQIKKNRWESLSDIEERVKDAQKSINNWIFFVSLEIAAAVVAILITTVNLDKLGDSASNTPSLYEITEGKKIDASKMAGVVTEKIKETLSFTDIIETVSNIPQSTVRTSVIIIIGTLLMLAWKIVKKKHIQQELEDKKKVLRGKS